MQSKPLRQAISLALDTLAMRGPVTRRQVVQQVLHTTSDSHWSIADEMAARAAYLMGEVTVQMNEKHSDKYLADNNIRLPEALRPLFSKMPRFICISPKGGRDAEHVLALHATIEDWEANAALKGTIARATNIKRDEARTYLDFLIMHKANTLAEYLAREK